MTDWADLWTRILPRAGTPTAPALLASPFVQHRAPPALRELWARATSWGEPDLRVCFADVDFAQRHRAPVPGGFTFGHNYGRNHQWRGLFVDLTGTCGVGAGAVLAWVPEGRFAHLWVAAPSLEALVERTRAGKRLALKALGAVHAADLARALERADGVESTPPTVDRPADTITGGSAATSWLYSVVGSLRIDPPGIRIGPADERVSHPLGDHIGSDDATDYVVSRGSFDRPDGRLLAIRRGGDAVDDLGYLLPAIAAWVRRRDPVG